MMMESMRGLRKLRKSMETPKPIFVSMDLSNEEESDLITLLKEYKDCFAWSYEDMKGVPPKVVQHTIPIRDDAKSQCNNDLMT